MDSTISLQRLRSNATFRATHRRTIRLLGSVELLRWWLCMLLGATLSFPIMAVQRENWRFPFYRSASELGLITGSPSGMFWDDLSGAADFGQPLWPDSAAYRRNHWSAEPWVAAGFRNGRQIGDTAAFWHAELLSDIRLRTLTVRHTLDIDSRYVFDKRYPWMTNRGVAGRFEEAYVQADWKWGMARLGRLKRNWGPFIDRSLILSSLAYSYDAVECQVYGSFFEFRNLFAAFPWKHSWRDTDDGRATGRYFTAHSLNFMVGRWASLGVTEAVLFTRESGFPDLQYVNPLSVYFVTNTNGEGDDGNLMVGFQAAVHPIPGTLTLKSQLVIDDFQVDNATAADQEPAHWGIDAAAYWIDPIKRFYHSLIKAQYRYLSRWLYTVDDPNADRGERYMYLGRSLGLEPIDGDEISADVSLVGRNWWMASLGMRYGRWGGGTIHTRWSSCSTYSGVALGYRRETPLSQRAGLFRIFELYTEARGYYRDRLTAAVEFTNRFTRQAGRSSLGYEPMISCEISLHYPMFFFLRR